MTPDEKKALLEKLFCFHTKRAPGLAIGIDMVELGLEKLGPVKDKINAVCEGQSCIIDVLQNMTGCTYGNRYLRVLNHLGRFAFTLYDRADGRGVRVFVDVDKIDPNQTPEIAKFFSRTRSAEVKKGGPARADSAEKIMKEFSGISKKILAWYPVKVLNFEKPDVYPAAFCQKCSESFLVIEPEQKVCRACSGSDLYFEKI
ncbi:MAG: FmdE family protein [Candidatus Rifleibacteriota bacterium]